jgi:hypothetical protein
LLRWAADLPEDQKRKPPEVPKKKASVETTACHDTLKSGAVLPAMDAAVPGTSALYGRRN